MIPALLILVVFAAVSCEKGDRFSVVCNEDYYPALQKLRYQANRLAYWYLEGRQ